MTHTAPPMGATPAPLGVVVGMADEARLLLRGAVAPSWLVVAGASAVAAEAGARRLAEAGAAALISFGIGGGLAPGLRPGTLVLATRVVLPDGTAVSTDAAWSQRWAEHWAACAGAVPLQRAPVAGSAGAVTTAADKAILYQATGAALVDMESHGVAVVAAACGLPLLVLRVVADPAHRGIPPLALAGLDAQGQTRPGPVIRGLLRRPWLLPALLALARDSATAMRTLARVAAAHGAISAWATADSVAPPPGRAMARQY